MFYKVLGLMSGTSLDGLDIAYCEFDVTDKEIKYAIKQADTVEYDDNLRSKIIDCETFNAEKLCEFSAFLGHYFGYQAKNFLQKYNLNIDFVASHGQTIFHQPYNGFTTQIGDINAIASEVKTDVIGDFRSLDVALGGQGAPLVPIGDKLLFYDYDCCLNIGGFSNISYDVDNTRIAYDICPSNIVLNMLATQLNKPYDKDGNIAKNASINTKMLNDLTKYDNITKQSLSKEWVKQNIFPILDKYNISLEDKIATYTEYIAEQISKHIKGKTLVTGGGAYNKFLIEKIKKKSNQTIIIPDRLTIEYKEALIFAFLGVRRKRKEINCLASVTGAKQDSSSGLIAIYI